MMDFSTFCVHNFKLISNLALKLYSDYLNNNIAALHIMYKIYFLFNSVLFQIKHVKIN